MGPTRAPGGSFSYEGLHVDPEQGVLSCHYRAGTHAFTETFHVPAGRRWSSAAQNVARLLYLVAGVSYYKTTAAPVIDLGATLLLPGERDLLRSVVVDGLGEFALRNGIDLHGLEITGGSEDGDDASAPGTSGGLSRVAPVPARPLVPFGGGIDSIVSVELLRERVGELALFVASPPGARFEAIESPAARSGLEVVRAERVLDAKVLRPAEHGYSSGHVPVTAIVSVLAALCALVEGRDAVVMSNERSASVGNVRTASGSVNHQWSKGWELESALAAVLHRASCGELSYFSLLRPWSELWIARQFSHATSYHDSFRSCNRSFALDPAKRLGRWCGTCDKCCFVDLVLAPFLPAPELSAIFSGHEPLENAGLRATFEALLGLRTDAEPWECVGDVAECRASAVLAGERPDRAKSPLVHDLVSALGEGAADARASLGPLLEPAAPHRVPDALLPSS